MKALESALLNELALISSEPPNQIAYAFKLTIHANGIDHDVLYVNDVGLLRHYEQGYGDQLRVSATLTEGVYVHDIIPFKNNLEGTLTRIPLAQSLQHNVNVSKSQEVYRYKVVLYDGSNPTAAANSPIAQDKQSMDRASIVTVDFQLLDPVIERIRLLTVGGTCRKSYGAKVIRVLLSRYSKTNELDATYALRGVDIAPNFNETIYENIPIPHGTKVVDMPHVVNELTGGIYSTGFHYYFQMGMWYLYPLYDVKRFESSQDTLTILNVPTNRMPGIENSYRKTATQLIVIATGETKLIDDSEKLQLNYGNGVRFLNANNVMRNYAKVENNKAIIDRTKIMGEAVVNERPSGDNLIVNADVRITASLYLEYSKLARRMGSIVQHQWENSDDKYLYPGMPTKLMYMKNDTAIEVTGVLIGAETNYSVTNRDPVTKRFTSTTALTVFIDSSQLE